MTRSCRHHAFLAAVGLTLASCSAAVSPTDVASHSTPGSSGAQCQVGDVVPVVSVQDGRFESVAAARDGSVYTSNNCTGDVLRILPSGETNLAATVPFGVDNSNCDLAGTLGIAVSDDLNIWVVVVSPLPELNGVWRIHPDGSTEHGFLMPPEEAPLPNDLAFDSVSNLYVTESETGVIWKAPPGGPATPWLTSDVLAPPPGHDLGANGVAFQEDALYVSNFDRGTIVKIPLEADGSPGEPVVVASILRRPDAVEFDAFGVLYAVTAYGAELVRIAPGGKEEVLIDLRAAGVAFPTGIAFGTGPGELTTAYIAQLLPSLGQANVVKVDLCVAE